MGGLVDAVFGGNDVEVPEPDPALIAAQVKSMGIQDVLIQQLIDNSNAMLPLQKQQMEFGLKSSEAAYDQSQQDRDWLLDRRGALAGVQDTIVQDARSFNAQDKATELSTKAQADVQKSFDNAQGQQQRQLTRMGVDPSSGKFAAMSNANSLAKASALASAANTGRQQAEDMGYKLTDRANNALAGYPSTAMQATQSGANYGGMGLNLANQALTGMNSGLSQASDKAGNAAQGYGSIWNQQNNAYQAAQNASASASAGLGQALGQIGMMAYMSDRRLKTDIEWVGRDVLTGLNLYHFRYIGGSKQVYEGVMADEVAVNYPNAVFEMPDGYLAVNYAAIGIEMKKVEI